HFADHGRSFGHSLAVCRPRAKGGGTEFPWFVRNVKFCKDVSELPVGEPHFGADRVVTGRRRRLDVQLPRTLDYGRLCAIPRRLDERRWPAQSFECRAARCAARGGAWAALHRADWY